MSKFWRFSLLSIPVFTLLGLPFFSLEAKTQEARTGETLLITAFEPFAGRPNNRSQAVAEKLAALLKKRDRSLRVEICTLPVVYDLAAEVAAGCLRSMEMTAPVTRMLSLGEGDCTIQLEMKAHNLDDTPDLADNGGTLRANRAIEENGPGVIELDDSLARKVPLLSDTDRKRVQVSEHMGAFVCNNTAYRMGRYFKEPPAVPVPYAFVHVPPAYCGGLSDPTQNAAILARLLGK